MKKTSTSNSVVFALFGLILLSANVTAQPSIIVGSTSGDQGVSVLLPVTVAEFESISDFRFSLLWDNAGLTLNSVQDLVPGIQLYFSGSSMSANLSNGDLTLPRGAVLFNLDFTITGNPATFWPVNLQIESLFQNGVALIPNDVSGMVNVNAPDSPVPIFLLNYAEALAFTNVSIPVTVQNFGNITAFNFHVTTPALPYIGVQDVYPGVVITPPVGNTLSVSYNGANLSLADGTVLFHVVYEVIGLPGMDRPVFLDVASVESLGISLQNPPQQVGTIHIIDPLPLTVNSENLTANLGEEVVMPITVTNFTDVRELDFTCTWDPSAAEFLLPEFLDPRISYFDSDGSDGVLQGTYHSDLPISQADGTTLVALRFRLNEFTGLSPFTISITEARIGFVNTIYSGAHTVNGSFMQSFPTITAATVSGIQNTNILMPVTADHFVNIKRAEFTLSWDKPGLILNGIVDQLPGLVVDVTEFGATVMVDNADLTLSDGTVLFNASFNINGNPGTSWPVDLLITSMKANDVDVPDAVSVSGMVNVEIPVPTFYPQWVDGPALSTVRVPIIVENFYDIEAFQFNVSWQNALITYDNIHDVYPGVTVTLINSNMLSVSYNGSSLTLPDNTALFQIAYQLNGAPGTDHEVVVDVTALEAWGESLTNPPQEANVVHIIDPDPITIIAADIVGYAGQEIAVPITVANFDNVRRVYLNLTWDPSICIYLSADFVDPHINYIDYLPQTSSVILNFFSNPPTSLDNGDTLAVLHFFLNGSAGSTPVHIVPEDVQVEVGTYSELQVVDGNIVSEPPLMLNIPTIRGERFSNVNIPVTVFNFQNITAISSHVRWDQSKVELKNVTFQQTTSWDSVHIENGLAFIGLTFAAPLNLDNGTTLLNLDFGLTGEYADTSEVVFDTSLPWEVAVNNVVRDGVVFNDGSVIIDELMISGHIEYPNNENIQHVRVVATDMVQENFGTTNDQGYYETQISGSGPSLSVTPYKDDPFPLNGLDMADVTAISEYLVDPVNSDLTSAYQVIAADVDNNGTITNADAQLLETILLGNSLPSEAVWKFIDASHVFSDINNPYPYPNHFEVQDYNTLLPGSQIDFVGVKTGDVNLSRDNSQQERTRASGEVTLEVNTKPAGAGITEVQIKALDFADIRAYQFTLSWDAYAFDLLTNSLFTKGPHSETRPGQGNIATVWQTPTTTTLANGTTLVSLLLKAKDETSTARVRVSDVITPTKVFDHALSKLSVKVIERLMQAEENGLNVYPNPSASISTVVIHSSSNEESSIEISDLTGKPVFTNTLMLSAGQNVLQVDTEKWAKGIYLLKLQTSTRFEVKKIIKN
jgi:hypothetical protein